LPQFERRLRSISMTGSEHPGRQVRVVLRPSTIKPLAVRLEGRRPATSCPSPLPPKFLQSGHSSSIRFEMSIKTYISVTRNGAFATFVRPAPQSDPRRHDRARIVLRAETAATRTRDGRSSFHRLASVDQGHPGILGSLRFRRRCVRKWMSRTRDRKTARRSRGFRHRSSPHPEGTLRKREKGPHDACGSRDSDNGRPGMSHDTSIQTLPHRQPPVNRSVLRLL
jgi:hypothetical protein